MVGFLDLDPPEDLPNFSPNVDRPKGAPNSQGTRDAEGEQPAVQWV